MGHPLAHEVAKGHIIVAAIEYEAQKQALENELTEDVYVATVMVLEMHDGSHVSCTSWAKDVVSLLPQVARIAFLHESSDADIELIRRGLGRRARVFGSSVGERAGARTVALAHAALAE